MRINIRTFTIGLDWENSHKHQVEETLKRAIAEIDSVMVDEGLDVKTKRVVVPPLNRIEKCSLPAVNNVLQWISGLCEQVGIRWFCAPIDMVGSDNLERDQRIAFEVMSRYPNTFLNIIAARNGEINAQAALAAAKVIKQISKLSKNGYDNFRLGVGANCVPNTPYFPFTYHEGDSGFSVAVELAAPILSILQDSPGLGLEAIRSRLLEELTPGVRSVDQLCRKISSCTGLGYKGLDLSLAPLPGEEHSVGRIVEALGVDAFGCSGTLFITSYLKDILRGIIERGGVLANGFNGVMYSLLEDSGLCRSNNAKMFSAESIVSFASVCGCGLDMVPLPGNVFESEIASLILDVCGLSTALKKPLGVRVLPIPMKQENEHTDFSHDFLYNTRILEVRHRMSDPKLFGLEEFRYLRDLKPEELTPPARIGVVKE